MLWGKIPGKNRIPRLGRHVLERLNDSRDVREDLLDRFLVTNAQFTLVYGDWIILSFISFSAKSRSKVPISSSRWVISPTFIKGRFDPTVEPFSGPKIQHGF